MMTINIRIDEILTSDCRIRSCKLVDNVLAVEFDRILKVETHEAINNLLLEIFGWSNLIMQRFVEPAPEADGHWEKLDEFEPLETIDVIRVAENRLTLEGPSQTGGGWLRYDIYESDYRMTC